MKRLLLVLSVAVISLNMMCAVIDYSAINHQTLPVYSGSLNNPIIKIVYEDPYGLYVFIEYEGVLYVCYL
ncbi:MAG: hypothetical protein PHC50_00015 [Candidatus Cloacimonetes bacterium]|nr:hypothetical protein [Candidatus Cloacimonadota bacterium]